MSNVNILRASPEHIGAIYEITKRAFSIYKDNLHADAYLGALTETEADIAADIKDNAVFVAEKNQKILGCVRISALSKDVAYLYRFAVDDAERNNGVGAELLRAVIDYCNQHNFALIALHTNAKYYKLARYYYGMNFYVHSTDNSRGYIRALFIKELSEAAESADLECAFKK
ncbi:MAG: GNAT family N-acetyltransferase [Clostridiales bacterium]|jgi:predicted N-acetyltransferase YhbS|nr:GNAT family N-acetyltransferase [Clostridiales bacterium]